MIRNESDVAAVIVEPVVGTNGVLVPPPEYFPRLRKICDRHGVLLIADEVMSGWGRTGKWFAVNHWGVKPDILVTAKGITSAYVPLGLCATTAKIADYFEDHYFSHGHTYKAHPLTLGPAVTTIEEMQRLNLVDRAAALEPYVRKKLLAIQAKHPAVGNVRGLGLFFGVELVKNRATKEPFNTMRDKVEGKPLVVNQIAAKMVAGRRDPRLDQPLRHRPAADRERGRDRHRPCRARRKLRSRRRAGSVGVRQASLSDFDPAHA